MNNFLSHLSSITIKKKKRVGRGLGSGRGAKSGRGTTRHQKARENIPLGFEGGQGRLTKRFPLLRGKGRNRSRKDKRYVIYTKDLNAMNDGDIVDVKKLKEMGFIDKKEMYPQVKVIVGGKLEKKVTVKLLISQSAKTAVEKAGGSVKSI
ncbi:50S ribosomal protein L15 [Candidatus Roizmanbacteria bacterium RIFOXYB2_FULL_38_10]|uniref:Large ribosomal subunit protein uL15 n=1 Tax=Candidatus Roizmanbacteria bacterium RIFOXYD1_FULL_38_12 TaxID=1802093 RepID=A0A1F7KZS5_9BACT|nr:MAG: 50S ribosomal protein L15 [Candidatus Roizmanbacteria bacterium RIFOXYA2_FULL_38_14]OGK63402.1 MAG: 50S ribosomal protein L15 [Candidatus Roizmanbacteria bacterium RIFOXYA1_FULL_37_12]OGK65248.1 MAG: 50S ribosomal protein L15 [Candidatus Roizmanbacteria bacterium RIFOXYB1_FULL_40_23]OGK68801.1 MAG: 50S ribosomal protein L15 [Candidatus Roizmanbacteria bacterium RIFOXYB2_FULL_38_10]OGK69653.1 MAG: 50S ribosomal protein L15 [Candidatus Roizmanbacteria bacterium RIFOXYC1_FULL_38_14]OGK728